MVRDRRLLDRNRCLEVADAHSAFIARQHIQKLEANGIRQLFQLGGERCRLRICAARARLHVAAPFSELPIDDFECSGHATTLAGISTTVNIFPPRLG